MFKEFKRYFLASTAVIPFYNEGGGGVPVVPPTVVPPIPNDDDSDDIDDDELDKGKWTPERARQDTRRLRKESQRYRIENKALKTEVEALKLDTDKKIKDAVAEVQTAAQKAADNRVINTELRAAAREMGMVDLDGLKLADTSKLTVDEHGEVVGMKELLDGLKKDKSYLFKEASTSSTRAAPRAGDPKPKTAKEMTPEEFKGALANLGVR